MSVVPIGHSKLTRADIAAIIARGNELADPGQRGEWVQVVTDDGELVLALLNPGNESLRFGFGKGHGWYYVIDAEGNYLVDGRYLDNVLSVLS